MNYLYSLSVICYLHLNFELFSSPQDFTGVPAVVDLACMRDAMNKLGSDSNKINPLVCLSYHLHALLFCKNEYIDD